MDIIRHKWTTWLSDVSRYMYTSYRCMRQPTLFDVTEIFKMNWTDPNGQVSSDKDDDMYYDGVNNN